TSVTPSPTAATTPAPSCPSTIGQRPSPSTPSARCTSEWHTPAAATCTSTSPRWGGSSNTVSTATGLPGARSTTARISRAPSGSPRGAATAPGADSVARAGNGDLWTLKAPQLLERDVTTDRVTDLLLGQRRLGRLADRADLPRAARMEHAPARRV